MTNHSISDVFLDWGGGGQTLPASAKDMKTRGNGANGEAGNTKS